MLVVQQYIKLTDLTFARAATKFIQVSRYSGSEGLELLSGQESAYMTFAHEKDGALKARSVSFIDELSVVDEVVGWKKTDRIPSQMVSARDSHARRCVQNC